LDYQWSVTLREWGEAVFGVGRRAEMG